MAFKYGGQFNAYVAKATGQIINYARDPKRYKLAKYSQVVKHDDAVGIYYKIHPDDFVRAVAPKEQVWEDGAKRPFRTGNRIRHDTVEFQAIRYDYDFQIGWATLKSADYNVLLANTASAQNQCMLEWTMELMTLGEEPSNWAGNTAIATDLAGAGQWDAGTPENPIIKKSLLQLAERITLNTNGLAGDFENQDDVGLEIILQPQSARRMATTPEIHAIYKESLHANALIGKSAVNPNAIFGLPEKLYGFTVVVETAVRVSSNPTIDGALAGTTGTSPARAFVKSPYSAIICSRPGGVAGVAGAPNYSTFQRLVVGSDMKLQVFDEKKDELTDGHVVRHGVSILPAPATGFLVQKILDPE